MSLAQAPAPFTTLNQFTTDAIKDAVTWHQGTAESAIDKLKHAAVILGQYRSEQEAEGNDWLANQSDIQKESIYFELVRGARTTLALAKVGGLAATGAPLGTFKELMKDLPEEYQAWVFADKEKMSASWQNELTAFQNSQRISQGQEPIAWETKTGPEPKPEYINTFKKGLSVKALQGKSNADPSLFSANTSAAQAIQAFNDLASHAEAETNPQATFPPSLLGASIARTQREINSGVSYQDEYKSWPTGLQSLIDIEGSYALLKTHQFVAKHDLPASGPALGAFKNTLSFVSPEAQAFLVNNGTALPNEQWSHVSDQLGKQVNFKAKVGVLQPANQVSLPSLKKVAAQDSETRLQDENTMTADTVDTKGSTVSNEAELNSHHGSIREPSFGSDTVGLPLSSVTDSLKVEPQLSNHFAAHTSALGATPLHSFDEPSAHQNLSNSVDSGAPFDFSIDEGASKPKRESADEFEKSWIVEREKKERYDFEGLGFRIGQKVKGFVDSWNDSAVKNKVQSNYQAFHGKMEGAILGANAALDRGTNAFKKENIKAAGYQALRKAAELADAGVENAQAVVGVVGQMTKAKLDSGQKSIGDMVLRTKEKLPSEQAIKESGVSQQEKLVKWASAAGGLLLGMTLISVAGPVIAVVGGLAAGVGLNNITNKGLEKTREHASIIPQKLENLADRLGARRQMNDTKAPEPEEPSRGPHM